MPALLLGLALLAGVLLIGWWYSRAEPRQVAFAAKTAVMVVLAGAGLYLLFLGRAALAAVVPIAIVALLKSWPSLTARWRAGREGRRYGRESGVRTAWLAMTLDHASGQADGEVLQGRFAGRRLSSLSATEALALREALLGDAQSLALLEAWLDRAHADWRRAGPTSGGAPMTRDEALEVLGLSPDATAEEIKAAHHRLMLKLHPDQGGSTWMAAKLNQARDLLLS